MNTKSVLFVDRFCLPELITEKKKASHYAFLRNVEKYVAFLTRQAIRGPFSYHFDYFLSSECAFEEMQQ